MTATPALAQYGRDLLAAAREGKIDPVIGREEETARVIEVLSRRQKNNPCLLGEPGVGKTAVVEGLALRIAAGDVPTPLRDRVPVALDIGAMIAGAKYRGEFEERLKKVMADVLAHPEIILFIDEIHTIVGAGAAEGAVDAANILKPALARGEIHVIGATTTEEYRRHIEKDAALCRRFQPIEVKEPSEEEAVAILFGLRERYEKHHCLSVTDEALRAAVRLSVRYLPGLFLPDKALDLLDEAAARMHMEAETLPEELLDIGRRLAEAGEKKEAAIRRHDFEEAGRLRDTERRLREEREEIRLARREAVRSPRVTEREIALALTRRTGIPAAEMNEDERTRLESLAARLGERVLGQREAIERLSYAIRRSRLGLRDARRPVGSFLFCGPTGVGKTELALALAEALYGERRALVRLDMSEYMEKQSAARLIGAPPGYVGYEDGGRLTEAVRRRPYAVVLFDEMEKAHPDVYNLLLQIMDDGTLTDSAGRRTDFRNTVIIMTTNAGGRMGSTLGFANTGVRENERAAVTAALSSVFRPEFLGRVDDIILFSPLSDADREGIVSLFLEECRGRAKEAGVTLEIASDVAGCLAAKERARGEGARPLRRRVQREVEDRLSDLLLDGRVRAGDRIRCALRNGEICFFGEDGFIFASEEAENAPFLQE